MLYGFIFPIMAHITVTQSLAPSDDISYDSRMVNYHLGLSNKAKTYHDPSGRRFQK